MPSPLPPLSVDSEKGDHVDDAGPVELRRMLAGLNSTDNTWFIVFPEDRTLLWSITVHTDPDAPGEYELHRRDPHSGQHDVPSYTDHATIVTEILSWIRHR